MRTKRHHNYRRSFYSPKRRGYRVTRDYYQKPRGPWSIRLIGLLFILVLIGLVWVFFCSKLFQIDKIIIEREQKDVLLISDQEIKELIRPIFAQRRFFIFTQDNLFLFYKPGAKKILEQVAVIAQVTISKRLPDKLTIRIKERPPQAILVSNEKYYWLDWRGEIISELSEDDQVFMGNLPIEEKPLFIYDQRPARYIKPEEEEKVKMRLDLADQFILELVEKFNQRVGQFKITSAEIVDEFAQEIHLTTSEGWQLYFDRTENPDRQLDNLILVLDEKIQDRGVLEYIDLRFGDRIYYK